MLLNRYLPCRVTIWSGLKLLYVTVLKSILGVKNPEGREALRKNRALSHNMTQKVLHSSSMCYLND
jgi:hypothetical protein